MAILPNPGPSFRRLKRLVEWFVKSSVFQPALLMFVFILLLIGCQAWINVRNNLIQREVMNAAVHGLPELFAKLVTQFILFYLLLTIASVVKTFIEEHLGLLLRRGLTQFITESYLGERAYLHLLRHPDVDNPDQRITEDVKTLATNALAFVLIIFNSALNFLLFAHVLSGIEKRLVWAAAGYAAFGSLMTLLIGKRLVRLNINQLQKEADLRFELVRTREHAEAIALQHDEGRQGPRLLDRLRIVVDNLRRIIARNAFLGLFTNAFNNLIIVVPILIVAPLVIRGEQEIGTVTQAIDAFRFVVNAFSVLVTEFPRLTLLTAVVARLGELTNAIRTPPKKNGLDVIENGDLLEVRELTLVDPTDGHRFFGGQKLGFRVDRFQHTLIVGKPGSGKTELLSALAGLWSTGHGWIVRPTLDRIAFVSPDPYITPGTLRQFLVPENRAAPTDGELLEALHSVGLDELAGRVGGLDVDHDWEAKLPISEQQALALARLLILKPTFAVLNEASGTLEGATRYHYYQKLADAGVTIVTLSARKILPEFHKQFVPIPGGLQTTVGPAAA